MYEAKKIVFYDPFGGKRKIVTEFFPNVRYSSSSIVSDTFILLKLSYNIS